METEFERWWRTYGQCIPPVDSFITEEAKRVYKEFASRVFEDAYEQGRSEGYEEGYKEGEDTI